MASLVCSSRTKRKMGRKFWDTRSRARFLTRIRRKKSAAKSTVADVLKAYLYKTNNFIKQLRVMDQEENLKLQKNEESLTGKEFLRWTHGIYTNGQFFLVSMGIKLDSGDYLPIIDKDGNLLGDFSKLDDLSLCW